jgi:putative transposase
MNSNGRAPGTLPHLGTIGGDRGTPGQTQTRAYPHQGEADLSAGGHPAYTTVSCPEGRQSRWRTQTDLLLAPVFAWMLCARKYLAGAMTLGELTQAAAAFVTVQTAFNCHAKPPALPERITAVPQLPERGNVSRSPYDLPGEPRGSLKEIAMSQSHNHLNHATWECKYHVVFTPKYRKKALFGQIRRHLGTVFHDLARRKECKIEEGKLMSDHVHILISIPPKYSVAEVIGFLKGKSSIWIAQNVERKVRNFLGHKFWARGYFVSTVGRDEETIRTYIKNQEIADQQLDQLQLKLGSS